MDRVLGLTSKPVEVSIAMEGFATRLRSEWNPGVRQPVGSLNEAADGESLCLRRRELAGPRDSAVEIGSARAVSAILRSKKRRQREVAVPGEPAGGVDDLVDVRSHENGAGKGFPRSTQEGLVPLSIGLEERYIIGRADYRTVLKHQACCLPRVCSPLGCYCTRGGTRSSHAHHQLGALENGRGVSEDEVHGAGDPHVFVELPERMRIQRVLETIHCAILERGLVAVHSQRHCLPSFGTCRVPERYPTG